VLPLSVELVQAYDAMLTQRKIGHDEHNDDKKWLRYYLDYCHKYHCSPADKQSFSRFQGRLRYCGYLHVFFPPLSSASTAVKLYECL